MEGMVKEMSSIMKERVHHIKYGDGTIIGEDLGRFIVKFDQFSESKSFLLSAFERFLSLESDQLQKEYYDLAVKMRQEQEQVVEQRHHEYQKSELDRKKALIVKKKKAVAKKKV